MYKKELTCLIGVDLMKDMVDFKPAEINILNFLEEVIISGMIKEMFFYIMLLSDDDTELIIRSSEYARIHKGRI